MNTTTWALILIVVVIIFCIVISIRFAWYRRKYPYRWKCNLCKFNIKTDIRETYEISKTSHNHSSLQEFKDTDPWRTPEVLAACARFHPGELCIPGQNHPAVRD